MSGLCLRYRIFLDFPSGALLRFFQQAKRHIRNRLGRLTKKPPLTAKPAAPERELFGLVERFEESEIIGWLRVDEGETAKQIDLFVGQVKVASTSTAHEIERFTSFRVCQFRFSVQGLWKFCQASSRLSVRHGGRNLLITGRGFVTAPVKTGNRRLAVLAEKLQNGHVFNDHGWLQLSKTHDHNWKAKAVGLYGKLADAIRRTSGHELCICYGTLLGAARSGEFIGHDHDFDACYVCRADSGPAAKAEVLAVASAMRAEGFRVDLKSTCTYFYHDDFPGVFIDVFHLYFDASGELQWAFGVANRRAFTRSDFTGYTKLTLSGREVTAISPPALMAACIYGDQWQNPNPGFDWKRQRVSFSREAQFSAAEIEQYNQVTNIRL